MGKRDRAGKEQRAEVGRGRERGKDTSLHNCGILAVIAALPQHACPEVHRPMTVQRREATRQRLRRQRDDEEEDLPLAVLAPRLVRRAKRARSCVRQGGVGLPLEQVVTGAAATTAGEVPTVAPDSGPDPGLFLLHTSGPTEPY